SADPQLVARDEGVPSGASESLRLLAARTSLALPAALAMDQQDRDGAGAAPLDARHRILRANRLDVPADAARARSDWRARSPADDLLLHRRPRLELGGRVADHVERRAALSRGGPRLRHVGAA